MMLAVQSFLLESSWWWWVTAKARYLFFRLQGCASHPKLQVHPKAALHLLQARR